MRILLFAALRELAGEPAIEVDPRDAPDVGSLRALLSRRYGERFARIMSAGTVVVQGATAGPGRPLGAGDEVAVLPPVAGG